MENGEGRNRHERQYVEGENNEGENVEVQEVNEPFEGMVFRSIDEAHCFYKKYALKLGFGVVRRNLHRKDDEDIYHCLFVCNKFRKTLQTDCDRPPISQRRRPLVGTQCKALMGITDHELKGKWVIYKLELQHNHELIPQYSFNIPAHRVIPIRVQKELEYNEDLGLYPWENIDRAITFSGGYGKASFTTRDARNHIDSYRRDKLRRLGGNDGMLMAEFFERQRNLDPNFYHTINFEGNHLWNVFWADGRGRSAYKYFSDVVVVDSTYLINRYLLY